MLYTGDVGTETSLHTKCECSVGRNADERGWWSVVQDIFRLTHYIFIIII